MALQDLSELGLDDETLPLPIHGTVYEIRMVGARLGRALTKAATTGALDREILGDDRGADEYRLLLGEHYDTLLGTLTQTEWEHVCHTVVMWVIGGRDVAERVWARDPRAAPATDGNSSAGAPARTASTSTTSTPTARPRQRSNRRRR